MIKDRVIPEPELRAFLPGPSLSGEAQALLLQQKSTWELARIGYKSLESVRTNTFDFDGEPIRVQFNPGRMKSTAARVDDRSIRERPCFLCNENLPPEQKGILYREDFMLLVNPYPICPEHFTIAGIDHKPQRIHDGIETLLDLAHDLASEFAAMYNGPRCGASAPDHRHFQAGTRSFLPVVDGFSNVRERFGRLLVDTGEVRVYGLDRHLPPFIALESSSLAVMIRSFDTLYRTSQSVSGSNEEPMMNLVSWYDDGIWTLVVFPRSKHRPARFYEEGDRRLLVSPAAIDLCGVVTLPAEKDFERMQKADVEAILDEVTLTPEMFRDLTGALAEAFGSE
jgi:hypothetical protein